MVFQYTLETFAPQKYIAYSHGKLAHEIPVYVVRENITLTFLKCAKSRAFIALKKEIQFKALFSV